MSSSRYNPQRIADLSSPVEITLSKGTLVMLGFLISAAQGRYDKNRLGDVLDSARRAWGFSNLNGEMIPSIVDDFNTLKQLSFPYEKDQEIWEQQQSQLDFLLGKPFDTAYKREQLLAFTVKWRQQNPNGTLAGLIGELVLEYGACSKEAGQWAFNQTKDSSPGS